jgi:acetyltransferase
MALAAPFGFWNDAALVARAGWSRLVDADERLWLDDGRSVRVRPVRPDDEAGERDFVDTLSPLSRYLRFHYGAVELPPALLHQMTHVDPDHQRAWVALAEGEGRPAIVADARYVLQADGRSAEFALAVADAWQGSGLGRRLIDRLIDEARRQGLAELVGDVLRSNTRMIRMMRRLGGRFVRDPSDSTVTRVHLALAQSASCCLETACCAPN